MALAYEISPRFSHTYIPYPSGTTVQSVPFSEPRPYQVRNNGRKRAPEPVRKTSHKIEELPPTPESAQNKKRKIEPEVAPKKPLVPESQPKPPLLKLMKMNKESSQHSSESAGFINEKNDDEDDKLSESEKVKSPTRADREKDELIKGLMKAQRKNSAEKSVESDADSLIAEYDAQIGGVEKNKDKNKKGYQGPKEYTNLFKKLKGGK